MRLIEIAFPYRAQRGFGATSFALLFVSLIVEIELIVLLGLIGQLDLFFVLQPAVFPAAAMVSLAAAGVFTWRARAWTRARIAGLAAFGGDSERYAATLRARARAVGTLPRDPRA